MQKIEKALKIFNLKPLNIFPVKGDGSRRIFFRLIFKKNSLILIIPEENPLAIEESRRYVIVGNFLKKSGIPVPEIKDWYEEKGFILVEDLGNLRLYEAIKTSSDSFYHYFKILEILKKFQKLSPRELSTKGIQLISYSPDFVFEREVLYGANNLGIPEDIKFLLKCWVKAVFKKLSEKDFVLVHRDFQSKNIMLKKGIPFIIDFQGIILGPASYDLASLIFDPYILIPDRLQKIFINYFLYSASEKEKIFEELRDVRCFRLFQALGAYYKLSREGKIWFKKYIKPTRLLLKKFLRESSFRHWKELERYL